MLTRGAIRRALRMANAYGETGKHVFGRGSELVDGTYSDEFPRVSEKAESQPLPKAEMEPK